MSYTKGPWKAEVYADGGFEVTGKGGHSGIEAYVVCSRGKHGMSNETAANARLIAAAPTLLAALQFAVAEADAFGISEDECAWLATAREAISKALGEPK